MSRYRIEIDRSLCSGFGSCSDLAPEVFELGPDAIATVGKKTRAGSATAIGPLVITPRPTATYISSR